MDKEERKIEIIKWVVFAVLLAVGILGLWINFKIYKENRNRELLDFAYFVKSAVNSDEISTLRGDESDLTNPNYIRLKEQFSSIVNSAQSVRYLYLMGYDENKSGDYMFFYLDSQPRKVGGIETDAAELATPGEIYDDGDPRIKDVYKNGGELMITEPYTDKWGTFVTANVPVSERNTGKILAVIGADFAVKNQYLEIAQVSLPYLSIFVLGLAVEVIIFSVYKKRKREEINNTRMESILRNSDDAIYSCDAKGVILDWNLKAEKLYGYKDSEIIGKNIDILVSEEQAPTLSENVSNVLSGKSIIRKKEERLDKWGKKVEVLVSGFPIFDKSMRVVGISIMAKDLMGELSKNEELEKKNAEMEKMNNMMIERELKMIELKKKIEELGGGYRGK